jgi:hypothetical protein
MRGLRRIKGIWVTHPPPTLQMQILGLLLPPYDAGQEFEVPIVDVTHLLSGLETISIIYIYIMVLLLLLT